MVLPLIVVVILQPDEAGDAQVEPGPEEGDSGGGAANQETGESEPACSPSPTVTVYTPTTANIGTLFGVLRTIRNFWKRGRRESVVSTKGRVSESGGNISLGVFVSMMGLMRKTWRATNRQLAQTQQKQKAEEDEKTYFGSLVAILALMKRAWTARGFYKHFCLHNICSPCNHIGIVS